MARGSGLIVKVLIPSPQEEGLIFVHDSTQLGQLMRAKTGGTGQADGLEPELGQVLITFDVNVRWFVVLSAKEEETIWADDQDCGHISCIPWSCRN